MTDCRWFFEREIRISRGPSERFVDVVVSPFLLHENATFSMTKSERASLANFAVCHRNVGFADKLRYREFSNISTFWNQLSETFFWSAALYITKRKRKQKNVLFTILKSSFLKPKFWLVSIFYNKQLFCFLWTKCCCLKVSQLLAKCV